jgi:anti-anti-sigma factor
MSTTKTMTKPKTCAPMSAAHEDRWTVSLSGAVDASSASGLRRLAELLSACKGDVDLDLGGVTFMDRQGWANVCAAAQALKAAGIPVRIVNPSSAVRRLTDPVASVASVAPGHSNRGRRSGLRLIWSADRQPGIDSRPPRTRAPAPLAVS